MYRTTARRALLGAAAAFTTLAVASACGGDDMAGMDHGSGSAASPSSSAPATTGAQFNEADVMFAQMMIPHHQQAVEMATMAQTRASDAELKQIAADIKKAQDPEIATMTGWLTAWGQPTAAPGGHNMPGMSMSGMMSDADMKKLEAATGTEFDREFARMMIAHHNGAIQMAREQQSKGSNPEAKALAATIEKTQAEEITKLQAILDRL